MGIDTIVGATAGSKAKTGTHLGVLDMPMRINTGSTVDYEVLLAITAVPFLAAFNIGVLAIHLGFDRYGHHSMESDMFLWDPVNCNPEKKQRVHEIYAPTIAENKHATAVLYATAAPFFVASLVLYPIEKTAEYVSAAAERISKRYENSRVYKAFAGILDSISKRISIDEDAGIPDEKEAAYNIKPSPAVASLQNLLNE